jgi:hypothetical protein
MVTKLLPGGVAAPMGPHAVIVRSGSRSLGPTSCGLITPCGAVLSLGNPYPRVCKLLRRFALFWWRWFKSFGGRDVSFMHVEGEKPFSTDLKNLGV